MSLPELVGHLRDHYEVMDGTLLHWLVPGGELDDGLRALVDDKVCSFMSDCICEGGVAEIYAEEPILVDVSDCEPDLQGIHEQEEHGAIQGLEDNVESEKRLVVYKQQEEMFNFEAEDDSDTDNDYIPGDESESDEGEEAESIKKQYKQLKKKIKAGQANILDDVAFEGYKTNPVMQDGAEEGGNEEVDSDESIEEIGSDGEVTTRASNYARFKEDSTVPHFELGMKFNSKAQFRAAITRYALSERKVINFIKSDPKRVRAKCDWPSCPWVCLLSKTSRSDSWQIATLDNCHACPPRRDNKLVTSRRIAEKYGKFIFANPSWNLAHMKATVQEEMFADASIGKLKRAKQLVMKAALDATKGQYQKLYSYQLELLRSNPGSTVVVNREVGMDPPVFKRIYICLGALKKGFLAGCRKVIGLDGFFFKGATNGELICALGRDANNQMYPIAWAIVHKENNEEWDRFMDLLSSDLQVGDGEGWVFISDQQKV